MSKNTKTLELINYFTLGVNGDVGIATIQELSILIQEQNEIIKALEQRIINLENN